MNAKVIVGIAGSVLKLGASQLAQRKLQEQANKESREVEANYQQMKNATGIKAKAEIAADMVIGTARLGVVSAAQTGVSDYNRENGRAIASRTKGELSALRTNIGGDEGSIQKALSESFNENRWS